MNTQKSAQHWMLFGSDCHNGAPKKLNASGQGKYENVEKGRFNCEVEDALKISTYKQFGPSVFFV